MKEHATSQLHAPSAAVLERLSAQATPCTVSTSSSANSVCKSLTDGLVAGTCLPCRCWCQEGYSSLPNKTRTFFKVVTDTWDPDW